MPSTISSFCFISSPLQFCGNQEETRRKRKTNHCMAASFKAGEKKNPFLFELWLYFRIDDFPHFSGRIPGCPFFLRGHTNSWTNSSNICGKDRMILPLFLQVSPFFYNPACLLRRFQLLTLAPGTQQLWCSTQGGTKSCSPARTVVPSHVWGESLCFQPRPCWCLGKTVPSSCQSLIFMTTWCPKTKHEEREEAWTIF